MRLMAQSRVLLVAAALLAAFALACGDDDDGGSPADVEGVWSGTFAADTSELAGALCIDIAQLDQETATMGGTVVFEGEAPVGMGGLVSGNRLSFVWSGVTGAPAATASPDQSTPTQPGVVDFITGGTFEGDVDGNRLAGTFTSLSGETGDWSVERDEALTSCED
jgi:hypothetical protein